MTVGATHILQATDVETSATVQLIYDVRMLRRKRLRALQDEAFLVDLPHTICVNAGDVFVLEDSRFVAAAAADEPLMRMTGDLVRLAWHIGNRHAPCAIEPEALIVQREKVMRTMLEQPDPGF